jgi:hypothetical protein
MVARAIPRNEVQNARLYPRVLDVSARECRATVRLSQEICKNPVRGTFGFDVAGEIGDYFLVNMWSKEEYDQVLMRI